MASPADEPSAVPPSARSGAPSAFLRRDTRSVPLEGRIAYLGGAGNGPAPGQAGFAPRPDSRPYPLQGGATGGPAWFSFSVSDDSGRDDWYLSAYDAGFFLTELTVVSEAGASSTWTGAALGRLAWRGAIPGAIFLRLPDPGGRRWTVYFLLASGLPPRADLRLWRADALSERMAVLALALGLAAGLFLALLPASALSWARNRRSPLAAMLPYSAAAFLTLALSFRGGGLAALAAGTGAVRLAHHALTLGAGVYAWLLSSTLTGGGPAKGKRGLAYLAAFAALLALCAALPGPYGNSAAYALMAICFSTAAFRGIRWMASGGGLKAAALAGWALAAAGSIAALAALVAGSSSPLAGGALALCMAAQTAMSSVLLAIDESRLSRMAEKDLGSALQKLENASAGRMEFFVRMAEAIRTPVFGILASLEERAASTGHPDAGLALARAESIRLISLLDTVHSYAKAEWDGRALAAEPFNLATILDAVIASTRYLGSGKNLTWNVSIPIIEMRNDAKTVQQAAYSIVSRAARSPGASELWIIASSDTHLVRLEIRDDGEAPAGLDAACVPETRGLANGPGFDDPKGRLMDLEVTRRLSIQLGGSFAYARAGDRNAYSFVFPRSMSFSAGRSPKPPRAAPALAGGPELGLDAAAKARGGPGSVMIVDDEPVSLFTLKRKLESAGWRVSAQVSARNALARIRGGEPHELVLVDATMPEMSGYEFCAAVRERLGRESMPVIMLMDSSWPEEIERALLAGANDYLVRPAGGPELTARVKTHVDLASSVRRELELKDRMAEVDKYKTLAWLTAGVAHEINTPNNAALRNVPMLREIWVEIAGALDRLYRSEGDFNVRGFGYEDLKREIPEMLNDLYMGSQHIKKIVEDLKDYARGPDGSSQPPLDVNQAIGYAIRLLKHSIAVSTGAFTVELSERLPPIKADRLKLTQVIVNVIENALQALPDPARGVRVSSYAEDRPAGAGGSWVCVKVSDEGVGMAPETLASVFDPFFTTKRDRGGTGLGMPVAAGIVREMGGSMELHSRPGAGTTVVIRVPAADGTGGNL